jgi:uncharacterized protein (DUF1778 family)
MAKSKLFQVKPLSEKMGPPVMLRLTEKDKATIRHSASIRNLSMSEFLRRAGLGRRADVKFETEIVLALSAHTRAIREMYAGMVERGFKPPEELMAAALRGALSAMHRIEGKSNWQSEAE